MIHALDAGRKLQPSCTSPAVASEPLANVESNQCAAIENAWPAIGSR